MLKVRSVQVDAPEGELRVVDREVPDPGYGQVRIAVEASGICHSDDAFIAGALPGLTFPLTPGHEIAGHIEALGEGVRGWAVGDRVAVGWFGGYCTTCPQCRRGQFVHCLNAQIPGLSYRGGYADAVVVPATALARVPDRMSTVQAAPMACAGVTCFGALRNSGARPGDLVAVLGLGGLGHLGVQFAAKMGFDTVVIARGQDKASFAASLGSRHYIDATSQDVAAELQRLGGARIVLATASNSDAISGTVEGLAPNGELVVIGIDPEPLRVAPLQLILQGRSVHGHPAGSPADIEDTMAFAELTGISALVEEVPLEQAAEGYARMASNKARFRVVLTTGV
ncbi:MAG TPA: alcohol dehydrogenase catalytic domain-containing protein [Actinocrinis sp.]|nr:alcohol dehydrogenase catalytic domain-containing protein [Actinocrinis sp.]